MTRPPMILISRRPRPPGGEWRRARSWFGGAPRLGGADWPRSKSGAPLHFVAQLDLAEIAEKAGETPLPPEGALAFFVGGEGATIFVPDARDAAPTQPPDGLADLTTVGGASPFDPQGRALFPFWPVDFTRLDIETPEGLDEDDALDAAYAAQDEAVGARFQRREFNLSPPSVFAGPPIPDWWRCAQHVADELDEAVRQAPKKLQTEEGMLAYAKGKRDEARREAASLTAGAESAGGFGKLLKSFGRKPPVPAAQHEAEGRAAEAIKKAETTVELYENKIARLHGALPGLKAFAEEVANWTNGRDPWALMTTEDVARLEGYRARLIEFPEYTVHYGATPLDYLKTQMFATLPEPGAPDFAALPEHVRAVIAGRRTPRPQWRRSALLFAEAFEKKLSGPEPHGVKTKRAKLDGAALADFETRLHALRALVAEIAALGRGDPWARLSPEETALLHEKLARMDKGFRDIASAFYTRYETFEAATLVALASADDDAYATLPQDARALINRDYLLPPGPTHQMFGQAVFIQGDACAQAEEGKLLLLQLSYDDLMNWGFGDNGAYTFWISPDDLAARNWAGVTVVFECH